MREIFRFSVRITLSLFVIILTSCGGGNDDNGVSMSTKDITAFSFTSPAATGTIDQSSKTIVVNVPSGTDVTALVATFITTGKSVVVGGNTQVSGVTPNNFTSSVTYKVVAIDGSSQNYTVAITVSTAQWAQTVTAGNRESWFNSITVASDNSVYAAGSIVGTDAFNFGNSITATGKYVNNNLLLVKYNSSGVAQWAQTVTAGTNNSYFNAVAAASDGSVYAAGYISGTDTYNFGNSMTAAGTSSGNNLVLVKYNSSGVAQWARTITAGTGNSRFYSVSVASDGSVYAAGYISGTGVYNFGNGMTATGTYGNFNVILVKYNSSGTAQWAQTVTAGNNNSYFTTLSVAADGSVYAAGSIFGTDTYNFGNGMSAAGTYTNTNVLLVKYDSTGAAQWARTVIAGNSFSLFNGVAVALDGSIYAAGYIYGTDAYNFGNSVTAAGAYASGENVVLVKYNSSGAAQWAQTVAAGSSNSRFDGVSAAADGSIYAAGYISGTGAYNFGNGIFAIGKNSSYNVIFAKFNSSGTAQWAQTVTAGNSNSYFNATGVASDGSIYTAGWIYGTGSYNFGNSVTATGMYVGYNIVLAKYN